LQKNKGRRTGTLLIADDSLRILPTFVPAMAKDLPQITFEFSGNDEVQREFLSGQPVPQAPKPKSTRGRKKLKDPATNLDEPVEVPDDEVLFQKAYYSISEVAQMFKVRVSHIRYWETEFDILEPRKNRKGDRHFRPQDIKNIQLIHDLIRRRKFTMEGAKEFLQQNAKATGTHELIVSLQKIRTFLVELKANL
jgi:DNA-binding transcriptional MerR regulator